MSRTRLVGSDVLSYLRQIGEDIEGIESLPPGKKAVFCRFAMGSGGVYVTEVDDQAEYFLEKEKSYNEAYIVRQEVLVTPLERESIPTQLLVNPVRKSFSRKKRKSPFRNLCVIIP
jgi:hypothetical protein